MFKQSLKAEVRELDIEDDPWGMQKKIYHWRIPMYFPSASDHRMELIIKPPFLKIPKSKKNLQKSAGSQHYLHNVYRKSIMKLISRNLEYASRGKNT